MGKDSSKKSKSSSSSKGGKKQEAGATAPLSKTDKEKIQMITYLESVYGNKVTSTCLYCLREAYLSEINHRNGYVTDEELIACSNGRLQHK
jgi:hypothetical protein